MGQRNAPMSLRFTGLKIGAGIKVNIIVVGFVNPGDFAGDGAVHIKGVFVDCCVINVITELQLYI